MVRSAALTQPIRVKQLKSKENCLGMFFCFFLGVYRYPPGDVNGLPYLSCDDGLGPASSALTIGDTFQISVR